MYSEEEKQQNEVQIDIKTIFHCLAHGKKE